MILAVVQVVAEATTMRIRAIRRTAALEWAENRIMNRPLAEVRLAVRI